MKGVRVAIIGGGAIGQVYGLHMLAAGAQVTYFVRERYVDALRAGPVLYSLSGRRADQHPRHLQPTDVQHDMTKLAEGFDRVEDEEWPLA